MRVSIIMTNGGSYAYVTEINGASVDGNNITCEEIINMIKNEDFICIKAADIKKAAVRTSEISSINIQY